jgi:hypothetical protein
MHTQKGPTLTIGILLALSLTVLVKGLAWPHFSAWSGIQLTMWLALLAGWANWLGYRGIFCRFLAIVGELAAIFVGAHLLLPAFWPEEIQNGVFCFYFWAERVSPGFFCLFRKRSRTTRGLQTSSFFTSRPLLLSVPRSGCLISPAPLLLPLVYVFYYTLLGGAFVRESLKRYSWFGFNLGLLMLCVTAWALIVSTEYPLTIDGSVAAAVYGFLLLANLYFYHRKYKMKRMRRKGNEADLMER